MTFTSSTWDTERFNEAPAKNGGMEVVPGGIQAAAAGFNEAPAKNGGMESFPGRKA